MKLFLTWGSNGSGKSLIASAIATKLACVHKKNVLIISTDLKTPALPVWLPGQKLNSTNSIGFLSNVDKVDEKVMAHRMHYHPKNDRIAYMGYVSGETPFTYDRPIGEGKKGEEIIVQLLQFLDYSKACDFVIADGQSNTVFDPLTLFFLRNANLIFQILTPDIKGLEYQKSQMMWITNTGIMAPEKHIKILNPVFETSPKEEIISALGGVDHTLPFAEELQGKFVAGELLSGFKTISALRFEQKISKIAEVAAHE